MAPKVVAYAVRALIGAAWLDCERNLETTSRVIQALSQYLESDVSIDSDLEMTPASACSSRVKAPDHELEAVMLAEDSNASTNFFDMDLGEDIHPNDDSFFDSDPTPLFPLDLQDWMFGPLGAQHLSQSPPLNEDNPTIAANASLQMGQTSNNGHSRDRTMTTSGDSTAEELSLQLQDMTIVHASSGGQQNFLISSPQPLQPLVQEHTSSPPSVSTSQPLESLAQEYTSSLTSVSTGQSQTQHQNMHSKLDGYIEYQQRSLRIMGLDGDSAALLAQDSSLKAASENPRHQRTMRKLYHGSISNFTIISLKNSLAVCRAESPNIDIERPVGLSKPGNHYKWITHLCTNNLQNNLDRRLHIYRLYLAIRGEFKSNLDDGFVNNSQASLRSAATQTGEKLAGNPVKLNTSNAYDQMLRHAERNLGCRSEDERARLRYDVTRLRVLGERLAKLVKGFGLGILCLLPFSEDDIDSYDVLTLTESE